MSKKLTKRNLEHMMRNALSFQKKIRAKSMFVGKADSEVAELIKSSCTPFLRSTEWKKLRQKVLDAYGTTCMKCGAIPKSKRYINVDHIRPRKYFPELSLSFDNLQVLCNRCNKEKGNSDWTDYREKDIS